jgi:hypothetical protein
MVAPSSQSPEVRNFLKGVLVIMAGAFMILPAYLNYEIFNRLHFQLVVSMSISLMLFAIGIVTFILVLGKQAFEGKAATQ